MKPSKEKLYDALGELIYTLAMSDGSIQESELEKLHELLIAHPNARAIQWSFDYEQDSNGSLEEVYQKALETCKAYGPTEEYAFLFDALEAVAKASDGIVAEELAIIERFKRELKEHFLNLNIEDLD